jgi:uncharacterized protein
MDEEIELQIIGLQPSLSQTQNYAIVLGEKEGSMRLPIVIGTFEAQAIAVFIEQMIPSKPLTHDVFVLLGTHLDFKVTKAVITGLVEGVFESSIFVSHGDKNIAITVRTSDAIAIAIRFHAPIYVKKFVLDSAGVDIEGQEVEEENWLQRFWKKLKAMLHFL